MNLSAALAARGPCRRGPARGRAGHRRRWRHRLLYSTFSTWILDCQRLGVAGRPALAWLNVALSLAAGFAAVAFGHWLGAAL